MAKKTKELFVRILCGALAGIFVLGCVAMLAIV
jgi:hypothetical protein